MTPRAWLVALALAIPFWIALLVVASAVSPSPITPLPQAAFTPYGATVGAGVGPDYAGGHPSSSRTPGDLSSVEPQVSVFRLPAPSPAPSLAPTFVRRSNPSAAS